MVFRESAMSELVRLDPSPRDMAAGRSAQMKVREAPRARPVAPMIPRRRSLPLSVRTRSKRKPAETRSTATRWARTEVRVALGLSGIVASSAQTRASDPAAWAVVAAQDAPDAVEPHDDPLPQRSRAVWRRPAGVRPFPDVAQLLPETEHPQPEPVQNVIIDHRAISPAYRIGHNR